MEEHQSKYREGFNFTISTELSDRIAHAGDVRPEKALSKMASTMRRTLFGAARNVSGDAMVVQVKA